VENTDSWSLELHECLIIRDSDSVADRMTAVVPRVSSNYEDWLLQLQSYRLSQDAMIDSQHQSATDDCMLMTSVVTALCIDQFCLRNRIQSDEKASTNHD